LKTIQIKHWADDAGHKLVTIPCGKDTSCVMDEDGLEELLALGVTPKFIFKDNVVALRMRQKQVGIPRLLCDCNAGQHIRYLDANPLNLRKSNLLRINGGSRYNARAQLLKRPFPKTQFLLEHIYE
jgi:hypothetical protein